MSIIMPINLTYMSAIALYHLFATAIARYRLTTRGCPFYGHKLAVKFDRVEI